MRRSEDEKKTVGESRGERIREVVVMVVDRTKEVFLAIWRTAELGLARRRSEPHRNNSFNSREHYYRSIQVYRYDIRRIFTLL